MKTLIVTMKMVCGHFDIQLPEFLNSIQSQEAFEYSMKPCYCSDCANFFYVAAQGTDPETRERWFLQNQK